MENQRIKSFLLVLLVVILLLLSFYIPKVKIGSTELRRINILSDVMRKDSDGQVLAEVKIDSIVGTLEIGEDTLNISSPVPEAAFDQIIDEKGENGERPTESTDTPSDEPNSSSSDTTAKAGGFDSSQKASSNSNPDTTYSPISVESIDYSNVSTNGIVEIEDFGNSMRHFYSALSQSGGRSVRVAFFGDSFIEGDILSGDLREMLQSRYGGKGVGWVDISCVSERFRQTARTTNSGWSKHHANDRSGYKSSLQGLNGGYFVPSGTGNFTVTTSKGHSATADKAIIYLSPSGISLKGCANGGAMEDLSVEGNNTLGIAQINKSGISKLSISASGTGHVLGVALEGNTGIVVDNYSMRGSNGCYTANTSDAMLSAYAQYRPYDLFIFQYGLNIANKNTKDYSSYANQFKRVIRKIKAHFPNASILILGSGDRDIKTGDGLVTMPGVKELIATQRQMAVDEGVAFWNTYAAMGGEGGIGRMQEKKQANLDYTHINFAGGKVIAKSLFDALTHGR